jgi:ERCC4-type nuclease
MGWAARLSSLANAREFPIRTLGDLRNMTDAELRRTRNVGKKMAAELRRFCPTRDREIRAISTGCP